MKRNLRDLSHHSYDLLVIGGGIYGACVTWDATLRGLKVALVEQKDFGGGTSANSLKTIHGGLRYLQHADFKRMRESIRERTTLMRIAPHLIHPLPILFPTYGHGMKGKEVMATALFLNDLISYDRNCLQDPQKYIPNGRVISDQECQQLLPGIPTQGLSGAAIFYDAQVYNSERLTLAFLRSAVERGAKIANYSRVTGFVHNEKQIQGVQVEDVLGGEQFEIRAKTVVNTSGPWINRVLGLLEPQPRIAPVAFAKAMNLVLRRPLFDHYAVGIYSQNDYRDPDAVLDKGSRLLFIAPWRGKSMVGTAYSVCDQDPDSWEVTEAEIQDLLTDINQAYPFANLTREDVAWVHAGLLPRSGISSTGEPIMAKHYHIDDYQQVGLQGLISVTGVKYTTARDIATKVVDRVFDSWGQKPPPSPSSVTPVYGGEIDKFDHFLHYVIQEQSYGLSQEVISRLIYNYGSAYSAVLKYLDSESVEVTDLDVIKAEVLYAVNEEMAQTLEDVILRRTELGSAGYPGSNIVNLCAQIMAQKLGWSHLQQQKEIVKVEQLYRKKPLVIV